jgi:GT2 family glycosyltransferase
MVRRVLHGAKLLDHDPARDPSDPQAYRNWLAAQPSLGADEREAIAAHIQAMTAPPLISVVMPVYEPPEEALRAAIDSVRAQSYPHWELCIADDASLAPHVIRILTEAAAVDSRIRWVRRETNGHISAATNTALELARGQFVVLMDHDDLLMEHALYACAAEVEAHPNVAMVYSDEDKIDGNGRYGPYFKPDFDADLLLQQNLVSHLGMYRRDLLMELGGLRLGFEGSQDHDLALRFSAACGPARIRHIPFVLYHWRHSTELGSFSSTALTRCLSASGHAVDDVLASAGVTAQSENLPATPNLRRVVWPMPATPPLVSVIVPTRDRAEMLEVCATGVLERTDYANMEFIIVDNDSTEPETRALLERLQRDPRVRILPAPGPFNYPKLNNRAAEIARGEILLLLNNDTDVIGPGWLRELVSQALRPDVGAVGATLLYANGTLQHGGVVAGLGGVAGHYLLGADRESTGHFGSLALVREVSAVTAACLALRREVFSAVGGFDEVNLPVAFNDVDLCFRIRAAGYRIIWTPFAELYHLESASRGSDLTEQRARHFAAEIGYMQRRWGPEIGPDPFVNPNLDVEGPIPQLQPKPPRFQPWAGRLPPRADVPGPYLPRASVRSTP